MGWDTAEDRHTLDRETAEKGLQIIADWLGQKHGMGEAVCGYSKKPLTRFLTHGPDAIEQVCNCPEFGPAPTGHDAAMRAQGPMLKMDWDWPSSGPTPTLLLEGGPYDWAVEASMDDDVRALMQAAGIFCEPYAGYALCLYPAR